MPERNSGEQFKLPKIGDRVYLPTKDSDFHHVNGGWAVVVEVERDMVRTYEDQSTLTNWKVLAPNKTIFKVNLAKTGHMSVLLTLGLNSRYQFLGNIDNKPGYHIGGSQPKI